MENFNKITLVQFGYHHCIPAAPFYLIYGLENKNIKFDFKFYNVDPERKMNLNDLYSFLLDSNRVLAVGCMMDILSCVIICLKKIKENFPEKIIVLGGTGPSKSAEAMLGKFNFIDYVIKGDGTFALPKLIKIIKERSKDFSIVPGLVYRNKGKIMSNSYDFYPIHKVIPAYHHCVNLREAFGLYIKTSWGCPYNCTYCHARPFVQRKLRYKDLGDVMEEIKLIIKCEMKDKKFVINIADEAFLVNRERVIKFCNLLKANNINDIRWTCYGRVGRVDRELLKIMGESGCIDLYFGIESGSNRILEKIRKGFTIEEALGDLLLTKNYIPNIIASFIYRFPFEKYKDFIQTLGIIKYLASKKIKCQWFPLAPIKDSEIYRKYKDTLKFSINATCGYRRLSDFSKESIDLIKSNPEIFPEYFYYDSEKLPKIMKAYYVFIKKIDNLNN